LSIGPVSSSNQLIDVTSYLITPGSIRATVIHCVYRRESIA